MQRTWDLRGIQGSHVIAWSLLTPSQAALTEVGLWVPFSNPIPVSAPPQDRGGRWKWIFLFPKRSCLLSSVLGSWVHPARSSEAGIRKDGLSDAEPIMPFTISLKQISASHCKYVCSCLPLITPPNQMYHFWLPVKAEVIWLIQISQFKRELF